VVEKPALRNYQHLHISGTGDVTIQAASVKSIGIEKDQIDDKTV